MSYNGAGVWTANSAGQPVVTGTVISSTVFNAFTADVGTGLSTCVTKDGQTTTSALVPFGQGISITGVSLHAFVDNEVPTGLVNSSNTVFTLAHAPSPASSLNLFVQGIHYLAGGVHYTLAGLTITTTAGATPQTSDNIVANYRY